MGRMRTFVLGGAAGAVAAYFFDPERGRGRRTRARDRAAARIRRGGRELERTARRAGAQAHGLAQRLEHPAPARTDYDDRTLADRVESELFADRSVPKGRLTVDVQAGVVVLRGQVDGPEQVESIEARVRAIPGVGAVQNLLHLPGTPAPNKADAEQASREAEAG